MRVIYPVSNVLQRFTLRLFADYKVMGRENVPPMGPLIIVANHQSNIDPPLLAASLPRRIRFLAKDTIFRPAIADWFLRSYGAFPLNREAVDVRAIRWVMSQLDHGEAVAVFPEGTRSKGSLQKGLPGVVQLALKADVPLLPVGITGSERMGSCTRVFNPTGRIRINIGTVFSLPSIEGRLNTEVIESLTDSIMRRIADLLPESYRGVYSAGPDNVRAARDVRRAGR